MAWSTRELADLAGTTVNTIRHYHRLGLLDEPDRRYNGYKQYGVPHLVRLLRIRRLAELGLPLARVGEAGAATASTPEVLQEVDAELAARIERLQQARDDIGAILRDDAPADAPAGFAPVASHLSEADQSIVHIYTQLWDETALADLRRMIEADVEGGDVGGEIATLPEDADEETRQQLAELIAPGIARNLVDYPWLNDPAQHLAKGERVTQQTFIAAVMELYNPAQRDVLSRAGILAHELAQEAIATGGDAGQTPFPGSA